MSELRRPRDAVYILRNIALAILVYISGWLLVHFRKPSVIPFFEGPRIITVGDWDNPAIIQYVRPEVINDENPVRIKFSSFKRPVWINRYANAYNRPASLVKQHDDYLGPRPHVDTEIDFAAIMKGCRGNSDASNVYKNTSNCLDFLKNNEDVYTTLPPQGSRASDRNPSLSEYLNSDGNDNTLDSYLSVASSSPPTNYSRGTCPGPIIPYHVYWRGPATWRVEIFIKSYLYTQNLPCSQLNLWLDSDTSPNAVKKMLNDDKLFARFLPLVERGDIVVRPWRFPSRILLPKPNDSLQTRENNDTVSARDKGRLKRKLSKAFDRSHSSELVNLSRKQQTFLPVAVSDAVRFIVLHQFGGGYFDMDVLMLRDMRPFYLPKNHSFAERWSTYTNGGFNTAIMSLTANSSLSAYFLQGAVAMGFNFHPLVLGIMSSKDGRNREMQMLEHGLFDPLWSRYAGDEFGPCPVPCFNGDYSKAFEGRLRAIKGEWRGYHGPRLEELPLAPPSRVWKSKEWPGPVEEPEPTGLSVHRKRSEREFKNRTSSSEDDETIKLRKRDLLNHEPVEEDFLLHSDIIKEYDRSEDQWPPTNRTLENFFRGAYTYHIHNQWDRRPQPNSWLNVMQHAHDRFFAGEAPNPYGEMWTGAPLSPYSTWAEFL